MAGPAGGGAGAGGGGAGGRGGGGGGGARAGVPFSSRRRKRTAIMTKRSDWIMLAAAGLYNMVLDRFIVLEGLDGAGTTTQLRLAGEKLGGRGGAPFCN